MAIIIALHKTLRPYVSLCSLLLSDYFFPNLSRQRATLAISSTSATSMTALAWACLPNLLTIPTPQESHKSYLVSSAFVPSLLCSGLIYSLNFFVYAEHTQWEWAEDLQRENRGPYICLLNSMNIFLFENSLSVSEKHRRQPGTRARPHGFSLPSSFCLEDTEPRGYGPFHASCFCPSNPEVWLSMTPIQQEHRKVSLSRS